MISKNLKLCALLLSFALFSTSFSALAGDDDQWGGSDREACEGAIAGVDGTQTKLAKTLRAKITQRLAVPESLWAEWVEANGYPAIQVGDEQGRQGILFEPFLSPNPSAQILGASQTVELHSLALKDGKWVTVGAESELNRIRIVPVGRTVNGYDLSVDGEVLWLAEHKTPNGDALLAVVTKLELSVFNLSETARLIFKTRVSSSGEVRPQWVVDHRGESTLIMATVDGRIWALFPESGASGVESETAIQDLADVQALRDQNGLILLANRLKGEGSSVGRLVDGKLSFDLSQTVETSSSRDKVTLLSGPYDLPLLASSRLQDDQRVLAFADVDGHVLASVPFDHPGEVLRGVHQGPFRNGRLQLAVRTDRRIYIVELH